MNRNKEACHCHNVTYGMILDAIDAGATNFQEVQEKTHCSTGCGRCREFIEVLVRDFLEEKRNSK